MADSLASFRRLVEVAVSSLTTPPTGVRGPLRGRDFMLDDLTHGADSDGR
jgi:hypothetical protein